jgi:RNA polymerase sigma factor (sigma-70 family)
MMTDEELLKHMKLVHLVISREYRWVLGPRIDWEDLRQVGWFALKRANEKYDPELSRFSSYASLWIRAFINQYVDKNLTAFTTGLGCFSQPQSRSDECRDFLKIARDCVYTPALCTRYDKLVDKKTRNAVELADDRDESQVIAGQLRQLTDDRNYQVILAMAEGNSLRDIGKEFGVSGERVRQIIERSMGLLKSYHGHMTNWKTPPINKVRGGKLYAPKSA